MTNYREKIEAEIEKALGTIDLFTLADNIRTIFQDDADAADERENELRQSIENQQQIIAFRERRITELEAENSRLRRGESMPPSKAKLTTDVLEQVNRLQNTDPLQLFAGLPGTTHQDALDHADKVVVDIADGRKCAWCDAPATGVAVYQTETTIPKWYPSCGKPSHGENYIIADPTIEETP